MSSTVTPLHTTTSSETGRPERSGRFGRPYVLAAAAFAILAPLVQGLTGWGLDQAEFAARGNATLRVEGYAFAIWGPIYLGLIAYAVRQTLPGSDPTGLLARLYWPSAATLVGIGLWIIVAAMGLQTASVIVIFASLLTLLSALLIHGHSVAAVSPFSVERLLIVWPLAALAGWLTAAAPLNMVSAATATGAIAAGPASTGWALLAAGAAAACGLFGAWRLGTLAYPLPIAWGLIGAFVAEQPRNATLAFSALGFAILLIVASVVIVFGLKRPHADAEADTGAESR